LPLKGIKVLDLSETRGQYAGKFLADLGADVIEIEPPQGSPARKVGPFKDDRPDPEASLYFINFNTNKRGITLNLDSDRGREIFEQLAAKADVVIEDWPPGSMNKLGLGYERLGVLNPRLIMVSVTGFGQSGPYSGYHASDIVSYAMGGLMFISGATAEPPVVPPCEQAYHAASLLSVFAINTALFLRLTTGRGQYIDIANHDMISTFAEGVMRYGITTDIGGRTGSQFSSAPGRIYPCKDGYVHFMVVYPNHWQSLLDLLGNPEVLSDKAWFEGTFRVKNVDLIDPIVTEFALARTKDEITALCQERGIPCTPVNNTADVARDRHMLERGFSVELEHQDIGKYDYLAPPYSMSATPGKVRRPSPTLGQHTLEILRDELGISAGDLEELKSLGVV
jgi:crotonobetainyl-CoA:carnitine CoA-transferase CaiB-like acyl-CoA transferase